MKIEQRLVEHLRPYHKNARKIPAIAIDKVAKSIEQFGWRQPIVIDQNNVVVAGHVRLLAAQKLGLKEVPVHVADDLSEIEIKAYRLADNRTHDFAEWNDELLKAELLELQAIDLDVFDATGFEAIEGIALLEDDEISQPQKAGAAPQAKFAIPPQAWLLLREKIQQDFNECAANFGITIQWPK